MPSNGYFNFIPKHEAKRQHFLEQRALLFFSNFAHF